MVFSLTNCGDRHIEIFGPWLLHLTKLRTLKSMHGLHWKCSMCVCVCVNIFFGIPVCLSISVNELIIIT